MRTWFSVVAAGLCLLLAPSMANAATIYACKKKVGGSLRIVKATTICMATETKISLPDAAEVAALKTRLADLETLLQHFSLNGTELAITGANLSIKSGSGTTDGTINGLGNLIVGYNELRGTNNDRTGSHNIVVGIRNDYSSYGGLVAGDGNTISAQYAAVSGGAGNTASGDYSSVSGGGNNTASGGYSSVSGGGGNIANFHSSSVSGGAFNTASSQNSSVSGGYQSTASGSYSSVSGGYQNTASGIVSSVSGGSTSTASGDYSSVSGGELNLANGAVSSVSGGHANTASGVHSSVSGGISRIATVNYGWIAGTLP